MSKRKKQEKIETREEKEHRLLGAIIEACEELDWIVSVNYKDKENETMCGVILGEQNFVANAEVLVFEHDEVGNFGFEETEEGIQLVEKNKNKMDGGSNLH